jgi:hypothetical protein
MGRDSGWNRRQWIQGLAGMTVIAGTGVAQRMRFTSGRTELRRQGCLQQGAWNGDCPQPGTLGAIRGFAFDRRAPERRVCGVP